MWSHIVGERVGDRAGDHMCESCGGQIGKKFRGQDG